MDCRPNAPTRPWSFPPNHIIATISRLVVVIKAVTEQNPVADGGDVAGALTLRTLMLLQTFRDVDTASQKLHLPVSGLATVEAMRLTAGSGFCLRWAQRSFCGVYIHDATVWTGHTLSSFPSIRPPWKKERHSLPVVTLVFPLR
jgi:hypothetical protein